MEEAPAALPGRHLHERKGPRALQGGRLQQRPAGAASPAQVSQPARHPDLDLGPELRRRGMPVAHAVPIQHQGSGTSNVANYAFRLCALRAR